MLTPVAKLFPGAQTSAHAQTAGARAETGPEGARALLVRQPDGLRRRHGEADGAARMPLATETYQTSRHRPPDPASRRNTQQRVEPLTEALARLDALETGLRAAPFVVASAGAHAAEIRLGDAPLRPLPDPGGGRPAFAAFAALFGLEPRRDAVLFGVGRSGDRVTAPSGGFVVVRVAPDQAAEPGGAWVERRAADDVRVVFAGGARLALTLPEEAEAALIFASDGILPIAGAPPGLAAGVDLRL